MLWLVGGALALILILAVIYVLVSTARATEAYEALRTHAGIDATATIQSAEELHGEDEGMWRLTLDLALADGRTFEVRRTVYVDGARMPQIGDTLAARCHPEDAKDFLITRAPFAHR